MRFSIAFDPHHSCCWRQQRNGAQVEWEVHPAEFSPNQQDRSNVGYTLVNINESWEHGTMGAIAFLLAKLPGHPFKTSNSLGVARDEPPGCQDPVM